MKNKVLFITNKAPHYRVPIFNGLSKKLDIKFIFTHENERINGLQSKYELIPGIGWGKYLAHFGLKKVLRREKPSKVMMLPPDPLHIIDNLIAYNYCRKNNIPFFFFVERWSYKHIPLKDKLSNKIHQKLMVKAEKVFVSGKKSMEWVKSLGVKKERIILAPDASEIECNSYEVEELRKKILKDNNLQDKKIILYVGRLISRKGLKYLISAFSKLNLSNISLLLVGGGDFYKLGERSVESKLKDQVNQLGLKKNVLFLGEVPHKDLPAYYLLADLFVYPSTTEKISEPWGLTLNEAMQFGLPLISTDAVGAAYDLIQDGKNGFMVKEKSVEELKKSIEKILKSNSLRIKMGKESKILVRKNSYQKLIYVLSENLKYAPIKRS